MKNLQIQQTKTIKDVIKQLQENNSEFLIITDEKKVISTITKDNVLEIIAKTPDLDLEILNIKSKSFEFLSLDSNFDEICEKFRIKNINFLPILNSKKELVNILTKQQFQVMLIEDIKHKLTDDFSKFDNISLNHNIYNRPWGFYKSTVLASNVQAKIIGVFANSELSLQEHKKREEHWVIIKGSGKMILGESEISVYPGKYIYIPKGCKHQIINNSDENIIFSEVQLGEYFGEDDIIRYSDKYGRA